MTYGLGDGLDMNQQLEGGFGPMRAILPIKSEVPELKMSQKPKTLKNEIELSCLQFILFEIVSSDLEKLIILMWSDVKIG